jgi:Flp pilus assembly protein protease CpaA
MRRPAENAPLLKGVKMLVIFIILSLVVISFLLMICLTLFRVEKSLKMTMMFAERKILKNYGYGQGRQ